MYLVAAWLEKLNIVTEKSDAIHFPSGSSMDSSKSAPAHSEGPSTTPTKRTENVPLVRYKSQPIDQPASSSKHTNYPFTTSHIDINRGSTTSKSTSVSSSYLLAVGFLISDLDRIDQAPRANEDPLNFSITVFKQFNECTSSPSPIWACTEAG